MAVGKVKIAEDQYQNKMQFAHINTASYQNITTATQWDTTQDRAVVITPTTSDAWIKITAATNTPAVSEGKLIPIGSSYTTLIRAGEYIGSNTEINVVNLGEL